MSKYEPLETFLRGLNVSRYRVSFTQVEKLLGFKLPKSALEYPAWWSNDETGHSHARAWIHSGWKTEELDLTTRQVTFVRAEAPRPSGPTEPPASDPWGCMAGTVTIMAGTDLTAPTGEVWIADSGQLMNE
jgi:hypothetical protein